MAEDDDQDKSSKTEEASEQKLTKAREKGDVPSSKETGNMMTVFSLFVLVVYLAPTVGPEVMEFLQMFIQQAGKASINEGTAGLRDVGGALVSLVFSVATGVAPIFLVMVLASIFGVLLQGETVVSLDRIQPKLSKVSPIGGLKKLFSADTFVEFLKNVSKVLVVGAIAFVVARGAVTQIWQQVGFVPEDLLPYVGRAVALLLVSTTIFLAPVSIFDIIWKRAQWMKKQRMTLRDVRDEHKDSEGDPLIKAKRMEIRRKRAQARLTKAVPTASVIITNPTHFAVALKYELGVDVAPVCVAKGTDLMAAQIRALAREHDIPIIENKPLARSLHALTEVDAQVPTEHWQAVAEIIGYVMDLRRNIKRRPPKGSEMHQEELGEELGEE